MFEAEEIETSFRKFQVQQKAEENLLKNEFEKKQDQIKFETIALIEKRREWNKDEGKTIEELRELNKEIKKN